MTLMHRIIGTLTASASVVLGACGKATTVDDRNKVNAPVAEGGPAPSAEPAIPPVERTSSGFRWGTAKITTPLPEGYPGPTAPGVIEVKSYPLVRRALVKGESAMNRGMNGAFWPLFRHIQSRDIEMTSPVEMDYSGLTAAPGDNPDSWAMSFLYRTPDLGPVGTDRSVVVEDLQPMQVVAIGFQGPYLLEVVKMNLARLEAWLAAQPEWERDGDPRALFYNGPEQWESRKWGEVHLPIRRVNEATAQAGGAASS